VIEDSVIAAMATGLAREYGLAHAAATATDRALAELDQGHVGVARTWRRILNALNQLSAIPRDEQTEGTDVR